MRQLLIKKGQVFVEDVPAPQIEAGCVLVQVDHSCISIGTEMSGVKSSALPLWRRALKHPDNVKKVLDMAATQGIAKTRAVIQGKLSAGIPTGYSAAGVVLAVGDGIDDIHPGERVACAGAQCAHHAEVISVPRNLTVHIADELSFPEASTVTLGAIALQGVRRANPTLGENFVVIGLGILGQLTVQMLKANGCKVIGVDLDNERIDLALEQGMDIGIYPIEENNIQQVVRITSGVGADGVIITAATPSDSVISTAFGMCRKKGRVVLVGDVGLNLNRADFYAKELDFFISTSYGPGRYDNRYEEQGLDYPVAYVRWTENRNMEAYLRLVADGIINLKPLIAKIYPLGQAPAAYELLKDATAKPLMVLLSYPERRKDIARVIPNPYAHQCQSDKIRIAVVGAGGFAKGMHLPNLQTLSNEFHIQAIVSRTGHNATATARQFNANYAATDFEQILLDKEVDAVLIATRHHLHTKMTLQALKAGKHVLVEKPLAINRDEVNEIIAYYENLGSSAPILLTGFNRRFSEYAQRIKALIKNRSNPMMINYRMNAGYIPLDHWVHGEEGGGRNIGEACHVYDLFTYLTDSKVVNISAHSVKPSNAHYSSRDNFVATMSFADGSVATLVYTALGSNEHSKERMEVYVDGKVLILDDFKSLNIVGLNAAGIQNKTIDKGQKQELEAFARSIKQGEWVIPLWQQVQAMEIAFDVDRLIAS